MSHKTKKIDMFWYFIFRRDGKDGYLRANALLEPLGIIAEPIDGEELDIGLSFGDGAIKMKDIRETIDLSLTYYAKAKLLQEGKVPTSFQDPLILETIKKIASDYDDPTTKVYYQNNQRIEIPYHPNTLLLPYRFISECQINIQPSDFMIPINELTHAEIEDLHIDTKRKVNVNTASNPLGLPEDSTQNSIPIDNEYQFKLIEMDEVDNTKCSWPSDKPLPFTDVLFFPSPASGQVVSTGPDATKGLIEQCKNNMENIKNSMTEYATSIQNINEAYQMEILLTKIKVNLHNLFKEFTRISQSLFEHFTSDGLFIPEFQEKVKMLTDLVEQSTDFAVFDLNTVFKRYDTNENGNQFNSLKSIEKLVNMFSDFHCIPDDKACEIKKYTEADLLAEMNNDSKS